MRLKPYDRYSPSEVMWFDQLPDHWQTFRFADKVFLKHGFQFRDTDFTDEGIKIVKITQLKADGSLDLSNCSFIDKKRLQSFRSIRIKNGDILMALTGGTIGKIIRISSLQEPILQNYRVGNFIPSNKSLNKEFLYYLLSSELTLFQIFYFINENGQPNIGKESFKNMVFPLPSINEQKLIAKYLFAKTATIDKIISLLETKTLYYKELSRTLINETVCKGLNSDVPLKNSGIEWIGEIPKHWQVKRLKELSKIQNGATPESRKKDFWDGDITWITPADFNDEMIISNSDRTITKSGLKSCGTTIVPEGSVIISSRAPIGSLAIAGKKLCTNQGCKSIIPKKKILNNHFIYYYLKSQQNTLNAFGNGTTFKELSTSSLSNFPLPYPPVEEQTAIAKHLDKKITTIDAIVANIKLQIDSLKELRKTLINDVVTGKLKVTE